MRKDSEETRACRFCGAAEPGGAIDAPGGREWLEAAPAAGEAPSAPRERSGLAHAAGFAGVLYLFRFSLAPLAAAEWGPAWAAGAGLVFIWSLLAPLALVLSFAAGRSLDRSPEKSGRLPAMFGLFVGWFGTVAWLFLLDGLWQQFVATR